MSEHKFAHSLPLEGEAKIDMKNFEECEDNLNYESIYHEQILHYIKDIYECDDFEDMYEFNDKYKEIAELFENGEI